MNKLGLLSAFCIAATGRDVVGDMIDSINARRTIEPDDEKQSAAEAKRARKASKRLKATQNEK